MMKINRRRAIMGLSFFTSSLFLRMDVSVAELAYPGVRSDFGGFDCYDFSFEGRAAKIVVPSVTQEGRPWIWRARFWGHEPQTDLALLRLGYHVAYLDSAPLLGGPECVELWQKFYLFVTNEMEFAKRAVLEGMSRGGLYVMNWAIAYPNQVQAIYIDNPVLDFRTWPGGERGGMRSDSDWSDILKAYRVTESEAFAYENGPLAEEGLRKLVAAKVPILAVCGDSDRYVPYGENAKILKERYTQLGGTIEVILKPGADHHPHSLEDPAPIVEFVERYR